MNENEGHKFGVYATAGTYAAIFSAVSFGAWTVTDHFNDAYLDKYADVLETAQTQESIQTARMYDRQLADIIEGRSEVSSLDNESQTAYQNGDVGLYETLSNEAISKEKEWKRTYNAFVVSMLTNDDLAEEDYKKITEQIEGENLPAKVWPPGTFSFYLDSGDAEYLNACRLNITRGGAPLTTNSVNAYNLVECMDSKDDRHAYEKKRSDEGKVAVATLMPMFLFLLSPLWEYRGAPLHRDLYNGYKNLYRRRKFGSVSRN